MKKRWICMFLFASLLAACTGQPAAAPTPSPAASEPPPAARGEVIASAEAVPARISELSFPVSGLLKQVDVQPGEHIQTGQILAVLDMPELGFAIQQAEAALTSAQTDWEYYSQERKQGFKPPERLQEAEARLAAARAALETAQLTLAQATLKAPFDGTIISVEAKPGEMAGAGQVLMTLASLDRLQIETTDLSERNVAAVEVGQAATVYIEALDQEFSGRVERIAARAGKKEGDVVFTVTVILDEQPQGLRWGMSAEVRIQTGE